MSEDIKAKLAKAREAKAKRDAAAEAEDEARELAVLELEEKYAEKLGKQGVDFQVVSTAVANFVVKKPDFIVAKTFMGKEKRTEEDTVQFVMPCVVEPDMLAMRGVFQDHGGVASRLAMALIAMYEAKAEDRGKKF